MAPKPHFPTNLKQRLWAFFYSIHPAIWGTGSRMTHLSENWREAIIKLPLNLRTRNYLKTIFGGSLYASIDPVYMLMLSKILGPKYVVWDKAAHIRFIRPGKTTLYAHFLLSEETIADIQSQVAKRQEFDLDLTVEYLDAEGKPHARIVKTLYFADKAYYQEKRRLKSQPTS